MTKQLEALIAEWKFYAGEAQCHPDPNYSLEFEKLSTPANVLALIVALEQSEHDKAVNWEAATSLVEENEELKRRIADLEASPLAVKLPKKNIGWDRDGDDCWNNAIDACAEAIRAAGGTVQGDE